MITTDPNELMEPFHDRMPAILVPGDYERWLGRGLGEESRLPVDLLQPFPAAEMKVWMVGKEVGNAEEFA